MKTPIQPAPFYSPCDDLWVITSYYNPARFHTKRANYERFAAPIRAAGIPLVTIECAFGEQPFELPPGPQVIQVRGRDVMWVKEELGGIFAPITDLRSNGDEVSELVGAKPELHREVQAYFTSRREDG